MLPYLQQIQLSVWLWTIMNLCPFLNTVERIYRSMILYCSTAPWESNLSLPYLCIKILISKYISTESCKRDSSSCLKKPFINGKISLWIDSILDKKGRRCNQGINIKLVFPFWLDYLNKPQSLNPHFYRFVYCHFGSWPEVHQFNVSCSVNKNILWFDVSVSKKQSISTFPHRSPLSHLDTRITLFSYTQLCAQLRKTLTSESLSSNWCSVSKQILK